MAKIRRTSEYEPTTVIINEVAVELRPENTAFVRYAIGKVAVDDVLHETNDFDHIKIDLSSYNFEGQNPAYYFRPDAELDPRGAAVFHQLVFTLIMHGYPASLNVPEVGDDVIESYKEKMEQECAEENEILFDEINEFLRRSDDPNDS